MKVNGAQTIVQSVEIDISDKEVEKIIRNSPDEVLVKDVVRRLLAALIDRVNKGEFKGQLTIREEQCYESQRHCHPDGPGHYPALIAIDADWNYHNNVGEDEFCRWLTPGETIAFDEIQRFYGNTLYCLRK